MPYEHFGNDALRELFPTFLGITAAVSGFGREYGTIVVTAMLSAAFGALAPMLFLVPRLEERIAHNQRETARIELRVAQSEKLSRDNALDLARRDSFTAVTNQRLSAIEDHVAAISKDVRGLRETRERLGPVR